jgi:hypothetical protein
MKRLIITSALVFIALAGSVTAMAWTSGSLNFCETKEGKACCAKMENGTSSREKSMTEVHASGNVKPCCKGK